jgi:hypothetical protein
MWLEGVFWRTETPVDRPLAYDLNHPLQSKAEADQLSARHLQLDNIENVLFRFSLSKHAS